MPYRDPHFRLLIEHSSDVIALLNAQKKIIYVSPAIESVLGYSVKEFSNLDPLKLIHSDDLPIINQQLNGLVKEVTNFQVRVRHKDGNMKWVECFCTNLLDQPGLNALVLNFRDITYQKEVEKRKEEFISIASHELKTPLAALKGFAQILSLEVNNKMNKSKIIHYSQKINDQIDRLSELVQNLLDVSRIQSGKLELHKENFSIDALIQETCQDMQNLDSNHKIETNLSANCQIWADKYLISQVLINLITNAIKYSPQAKKIIISSRKINHNIQISVEDFGIGINKKDLEHIFERFFQSRNKIRTSFSGLGLGLYISSHIISQHGGKIWAESEKGKGSTFFAVLPIK